MHGGQAHSRGLGELEHEHRQRPRRRERPALDRDHLREIGVPEGRRSWAGRDGSFVGWPRARRVELGGGKPQGRTGRTASAASRCHGRRPVGSGSAASTRLRSESSAGIAGPRALESLPEFYRARPHRQPSAAAPGSSSASPPATSAPAPAPLRPAHPGAVTCPAGGEHFAPPGVDAPTTHRCLPVLRPRTAARGQRLQRAHPNAAGCPRARASALGSRDPDPQAGERAGPDAHGDPIDLGPVVSRRLQRLDTSTSSRVVWRGRSPGADRHAASSPRRSRCPAAPPRWRESPCRARESSPHPHRPPVAAGVLEPDAGDDMTELASAPAPPLRAIPRTRSSRARR